MAIRQILIYPDPLLSRPTVPVEQVDQGVKAVVANLADTIYATTGVGLAAPQIGSDRRIAIIDPHRENGKRTFRALINPRVIKRDGELLSEAEGCKSLPGVRINVKRSANVVVEGLDIDGKMVTIDASGFEAIVLQHELDHLDGILTIDHLSETDRTRQISYLKSLLSLFRRIDGFKVKPDGVLFRRRTREKNTLIIKSGPQIQLYFATPDLKDSEIRLSGIMSRIDVRDPLLLLGIYTQAMMLSLVWNKGPQRVYMLGFGGGRIPLIFHHYFPDVIIDASELDPDVIEYAKRYFAIRLDERMRVAATDGRLHLTSLPSDDLFDIILIDCYTGTGDHPYPLSTIEFYEICKSRLSAGGVVATNLIESDPLYEAKRDTFQHSFAYTYDFTHEGAHVFFGTETLISQEDFLARARDLDETYQFHFPFMERAQSVTRLSPELVNRANILRDLSTPDETSTQSISREPMFQGISRNAPCPCGSGKKFKKCHGKPS